jgi:hypothetical protein
MTDSVKKMTVKYEAVCRSRPHLVVILLDIHGILVNYAVVDKNE